LLFSIVLFVYVLWVEGLGLRRALLVFRFGCWRKTIQLGSISLKLFTVPSWTPHQSGRQRGVSSVWWGCSGQEVPNPATVFRPGPSGGSREG